MYSSNNECNVEEFEEEEEDFTVEVVAVNVRWEDGDDDDNECNVKEFERIRQKRMRTRDN